MNKMDRKRKRLHTGRPQYNNNKKQKQAEEAKPEISESDDDSKPEDVKGDIINSDKKKISNDVKEGCTVFIKSVPFDASDEELRKVCRRYGALHYAIINREPISGHSRGTGFVKFKTKESADLCLQSGDDFLLHDEILQTFPALSRDDIHTKQVQDGDTVTDSRNLYLVREGLIMAGSKAADGVSASDMTKRHKLEKIKTQVLKNLNRFVSRNRLSIHNLPLTYDDGNLKKMVIAYTDFKPHECRVMRENKITPGNLHGKSKGFGFMSFSTHKEALIALRKLNNNPKIFGEVHRPIVAFSIEDRAVHKIKEKRQYKSQMNNPTFQKKNESKEDHLADSNKKKKARGESNTHEESKVDTKQIVKSNVQKARSSEQQNFESTEEFTGTVAKPGTAIRMRSNKKIMEQSAAHKKRLNANKRKDKQKKVKKLHTMEAHPSTTAKPKRTANRDDLGNLIQKYKQMLDNSPVSKSTVVDSPIIAKKPKRSKWYTE